MTDQELDRLLADALEVEPRPDFLARVRTEIGHQPVPSPWLGWWRGAAMAALVAAVLVLAWPRTEDAVAPAQGSPGSVPVPPVQMPSSASFSDSAAAGPPTRIESRGRAERAIARTAAPAIPSAQIAPDDAEVVRLALDGSRDGLFAPADRDAAAALTLSRIDLPLLEVEPLALMTPVDSGERQ